MTIDPVALKGTLAHIEAHPETWDQGNWGKRNCRTSYCFAGWACVLASLDEFRWHGASAWSIDDGESIGITAAMILGLNDLQANRLFAPDNGITELRRQVAELCREAET